MVLLTFTAVLLLPFISAEYLSAERILPVNTNHLLEKQQEATDVTPVDQLTEADALPTAPSTSEATTTTSPSPPPTTPSSTTTTSTTTTTTTTSTTTTTPKPTTPKPTTLRPTTTTTTRKPTTTKKPPPVSRQPSPTPPTFAPGIPQGVVCDFGIDPEPNLCSWMNGNNATLLWRIGTGKGAFWIGGPTIDFNFGDSSGGYAFLETSAAAGPDQGVAIMTSVPLPGTGSQGSCFAFAYRAEGLSPAALRVLLAGSGPGSRVLWEAPWGLAEAGRWAEARLLYASPLAHQLLLEGSPVDAADPGRLYRGYVAVDDLRLLPGAQCRGFCTFDAGFCDWGNERGDDFDWSLSRGSHSSATGPSHDATASAAGGYAFIDSGFPRRPGDAARLASLALPATAPDAPLCLRFWFHMFGPAVGALRVLLRPLGVAAPAETTLWTLAGDAGNAWFMAKVTVAALGDFQILLEATVGNTAMGDIAVDDVSFTQGPCPAAPQVAALEAGDCTFEVDDCGWTSSGNHDAVSWTRTPTRTLDARQRRRPSSTDNEYFLGLSRQLLVPAGGAAQLTSREFASTGRPRCFTFWYLMLEPHLDLAGPSLGVLRVLLQTKGDQEKTTQTPVWQLYNQQGQTWRFAQTTIRDPGQPYRIVIEGTWGPNRAGGMMAVDDIAFYEGDCTVRPASATFRPVDCSFERGLCEWRNGSQGRASWQRATHSLKPAQLPDRTFRAPDGYIFFDIFGPDQQQKKVELVSSVLEPKEGDEILCLTFWFTAFGAGESTRLQILNAPAGSADDSTPEVVWSLSARTLDTSRPQWAAAQVTIDNRTPLTLILRGDASNGGFTVDDIRALPGACAVRPLEAVPSFSENN